MTERPTDREPMPWVNGQKMLAMELWAANLMRDDRLSRGAIRVAWALQFAFHSQEGKKRGACWETNGTLGKRAGMTADGAKGGIQELDEAGHIIRTEEVILRKKMRVIRPCFNREIEKLPRRGARGGCPKGVSGKERAAQKRLMRGCEVQTPRGCEGDTLGGSQVQAPCILDGNPGSDPFIVQGVSSGREPVILDDDLEVHAPRAVNRRTG